MLFCCYCPCKAEIVGGLDILSLKGHFPFEVNSFPLGKDVIILTLYLDP